MGRGCGPMSLHPSSERSYEQTRANCATPGCTRLHSTEKSPAPDSSTTIGSPGLASPVQYRCRRHPPTSTSRPGGGNGGVSPGCWAVAFAARSAPASRATGNRISVRAIRLVEDPAHRLLERLAKLGRGGAEVEGGDGHRTEKAGEGVLAQPRGGAVALRH